MPFLFQFLMLGSDVGAEEPDVIAREDLATLCRKVEMGNGQVEPLVIMPQPHDRRYASWM